MPHTNPLDSDSPYYEGTLEPISLNTSPLKAGFSEGYIDVPVGTSQGGYGGRTGPAKSPYSDVFGATIGIYNRLKAKALVLKNDSQRVIIVTTPLIFPTDYLAQRVSRYVEELSGEVIREELILTANHSHSAMARYWRLPDITAQFGMDSFHQEIFDRLTRSIAIVIVKALSELKPARIGWGSTLGFDPDNRIYVDRRCENDGLYIEEGYNTDKDPRMVVFRIDDDDGLPIAVIINFPIHGTVLSGRNFYVTSEVPGMIEFKVEEALSRKYQRHIPAMFIQGTAGDTASAEFPPGYHGTGTQKMELLAELATPKVMDVFSSIKGSFSRVKLLMLNRTIPVNRESIGYGPDEFIRKDKPYEYGAFVCGGLKIPNISDCAKPETRLEDNDLDCVFATEDLITEKDLPLKQFAQTRLTALRINDTAIITIPGEPLTAFGDKLRQLLSLRAGIPYEDTIIFGFSQDHHLYIQLEEDWFQGGYETEMSVWGYLFGEYVLEESVNLGEELFFDVKGVNLREAEPISFLSDEPDMVVPTASLEPETVLEQPKEVYRRFETISFIWSGGDPAIDLPQVVLQKKTSNGFEDVLREDGTPFDDGGYEMVMTYSAVPRYGRDPDATEREHRWGIKWETMKDDPGGTYRFRVSGSYSDGSCADYRCEGVAYQITSGDFVLSPSDELSIGDLKLDESTGTISFKLSYPPNPKGYRLGDINTPPAERAPVESGSCRISITRLDDITEKASCQYDDKSALFTSTISFEASGNYVIYVRAGDAKDSFGNYNGEDSERIEVNK